MWTKQYTIEGKPFYHNITQNRSLWTAPPDEVVHEAEQLVNPANLSPKSLEKYKNEKAARDLDDILLPPPAVPAETVLIELNTADPTYQQIILPNAEPEVPNSDDRAIEERLQAAASQKQQQVRAKRFRNQDTVSSEVTEYQKLVNDIQNGTAGIL